jgi:hypothetical protein
MIRKAILETTSISLIILFTYASVSKIIDVEKFQIQIGQSPLLTEYATQIAWLIPILELIIVCLLSFRKLRLSGLIASFSIMTMFTVYIIAILNYAENVPCSCGGILQKMGWTEHLIFNVTFTILSAIGIFLQYTENQEYTTEDVIAAS